MLNPKRPFESLDRKLARLCQVTPVDVSEIEDAYEVSAEFPGVDEANIEVKAANGILTVRGEKQRKRKGIKASYRRERCFGSLERSFTLPEDIDADRMKADFKNGVLTITLPKYGGAK